MFYPLVLLVADAGQSALQTTPMPVKPCKNKNCQNKEVKGQFIPGGDKPPYIPMWRFKCEECQYEWVEIDNPSLS